MKRVVVIEWKQKPDLAFEVFSNLKLLCDAYPQYGYAKLRKHLYKNNIYEDGQVCIRRQFAHEEVIPNREIAMVVNRVPMRTHDEEAADRAYWLSRPPAERLRAVTQLSMQFLAKGQRMDKTHVVRKSNK